MIERTDEDAPVDGQTGGNVELEIVVDDSFAVRLDMNEYELILFVAQIELARRELLDFGRLRVDARQQAGKAVIRTIDPKNHLVLRLDGAEFVLEAAPVQRAQIVVDLMFVGRRAQVPLARVAPDGNDISINIINPALNSHVLKLQFFL